MSLHNEKPSTERLDKLARHVLASAIKFERAKAESSTYGAASAEGDALCALVREYRETMVAELIGAEPTPGSSSAPGRPVEGAEVEADRRAEA